MLVRYFSSAAFLAFCCRRASFSAASCFFCGAFGIVERGVYMWNCVSVREERDKTRDVT